MSNVVVHLPFKEVLQRLNDKGPFVAPKEAILFQPLKGARLPLKLRAISATTTKISADRIWERGDDHETQLALLEIADHLDAPYDTRKVKEKLIRKRSYSISSIPFSSTREVLEKGGLEGLAAKGEATLEIGCGNGIFLTSLLLNGEKAFGLEISNRCLRKAAFRLREAGFSQTHRYLVKADGMAFLRWVVPPAFLKAIYVLFPDPWDGSTHRRLINTSFLRLAREKLCKGGRLFMATDHSGYASQIKNAIEKTRGISLVEWSSPLNTKYQEKWRREGRDTYRFAITVEEHEGYNKWERASLDFTTKVKTELKNLETPMVITLPEEHHFVVEKRYDGKRGTLFRTVLSPSTGMAQKQFLLLKDATLTLIPTWHEVSIPLLREVMCILSTHPYP